MVLSYYYCCSVCIAVLGIITLSAIYVNRSLQEWYHVTVKDWIMESRQQMQARRLDSEGTHLANTLQAVYRDVIGVTEAQSTLNLYEDRIQGSYLSRNWTTNLTDVVNRKDSYYYPKYGKETTDGDWGLSFIGMFINSPN